VNASVLNLFALQDRVALVTGASSGIGARQALALSQAGAGVILLGRRAERLQSLAESIQEQGGTARWLAADLMDEAQWEQISVDALALYGKIDILCNTAGVNLRQPAEAITLETWEQTLTLNLKAPFFLARHLVPQMRERGWGKIINIASLQSERAFANSVPYGASKGGIMQLTRAMAEAWSKNGINCNAIAPGFFPTELTAPVFEQSELTQKLAAQTAMGRNGELADLDGLTIFLASPASDYITGQTIYLDGGFTAK